MTSGGHCRPGDALGIVDGDIVLVGDDLSTIAVLGARAPPRAGGELVTLLTGADTDAELLDGVQRVSSIDEVPHAEVSVLARGQAASPLLIGVE